MLGGGGGGVRKIEKRDKIGTRVTSGGTSNPRKKLRLRKSGKNYGEKGNEKTQRGGKPSSKKDSLR